METAARQSFQRASVSSKGLATGPALASSRPIVGPRRGINSQTIPICQRDSSSSVTSGQSVPRPSDTLADQREPGEYRRVLAIACCHAFGSIYAHFRSICGVQIVCPRASVEVKEASMSAVFTSHDKRPRDLALAAIQEALGSVGQIEQYTVL